VAELAVILACIAVNAALSALEAAFISASRADVGAHAHPDDPRLRRLLDLRAMPERTLSAIQIGMTLVSILSAAVGGVGAKESLAPSLQRRFALGTGAAEALAVILVAAPLLFATVVLGELVPKALALRHPERLALDGARWLHLLERAFLPVVGLLTWTTRNIVGVLSPWWLPRAGEGRPAAGAATRPHYALDLLDLARRRARDSMVPWPQTVKAEAAMPASAVADLALASGHTRLPTVEDGVVIGLLHTKELLRFLAAGEQDWRTLLRPAVAVGPDEPLLRVLRLLQDRHSHLAVVTDGEGRPVGVVTLEDILEEVLGDLYDEDDDRAVARLLAARGRLKAAGIEALHGERR